MAEAGGFLEVAPRDGARSHLECSLPLPDLQKYLEGSDFGIMYLNGRLLYSPKARPFALGIQSTLERARNAAAMNRVSILDDEGALLPARQTLATVGFGELQKMVAALMNGQKEVDEQPPRTKAEVPGWFPWFSVPNDARSPGHSPGCFLASPEFLPLVTTRCKAPTVCGRKPTPAEYREHKFRGRMQGLKQEELWPVVDAVFQHFRGQSEKLEKLEETMNRYFEESKPSVHLQATMGVYFSFLLAEARNQRASRETARGDCSLEGGQPKDSRAGPGVEVPSSESDGRGTSVSDKTEENTGERTPKRRRDAVVVDGIGKPSVLQKTSPETERSGNGGDYEGGWEFEDLSDLESLDFVRKHYWDDSGALMLAASSVALELAPERSPGLEGEQGDQGGKLDVERSDGRGAELYLDPSWMGCYSVAMCHQMTKKRGLLSKSVNALQKGMARLNLW